MSVCEHDPYCPGYGLDHDTWLKYGTVTQRDGRRPDESLKAWKRRERSERNARKATDAAATEARKKATAEKEAQVAREVAEVDVVLARHQGGNDDNEEMSA